MAAAQPPGLGSTNCRFRSFAATRSPCGAFQETWQKKPYILSQRRPQVVFLMTVPISSKNGGGGRVNQYIYIFIIHIYRYIYIYKQL